MHAVQSCSEVVKGALTLACVHNSGVQVCSRSGNSDQANWSTIWASVALACLEQMRPSTLLRQVHAIKALIAAILNGRALMSFELLHLHVLKRLHAVMQG